MFYGDSITETWRGTDLGRPCKRPGCKEGAAVFRQHFGDRWRAGVLGVAGRTLSKTLGLRSPRPDPSLNPTPTLTFALPRQ